MKQMQYEISTYSRFEKDLKKLLKNNALLAKKLKKTLDLLRSNPHHPSLRLHKLTPGEDYSVSVDMSIRIIVKIEPPKIYLLQIGTHDDVY